MNSRKVVFLFWSTLLIGTAAGSLMALIQSYDEVIFAFRELGFMQGIGGLFVIVVIASLWTVIAQMGFFAYLTIHRFGLGIFKSVRLWNKVQVVIIAFALFDLMFFRHFFFAEEGESLLGYAIMPLMLLAYAWIVAEIKARDTNRQAFVPTLFFMVVVTMIEWIPSFTGNDMEYIINAIVPLLVANTYQILILHRLHAQPNGRQPTVAQEQERDRTITTNTKQKQSQKKKKKKKK
ncbi:KinB-signaling pathway activation protein [Alkalicoccus chagannorensis]|uniref:KinB-signaling pathway activation protein n=1 Tax=Alkalicoccus chagannorensis TaxID=427072 RepID=UPI00041392AC|nr:KinB-signaling pathway activation protein [Alkalicoccus chagannorensis]